MVFFFHDGIWYRDASTHDIAVGKVNAQKDIRLELDNDDCALLSAGRTKDWSMFNLNWCQLVVGETGASEKFYHAMQLYMMSPQKCPGVLWMSAMKWLGRSSSAEECFQMPVMSSKCYAVPSSAMRCLQVLCHAFKCYAVPASAVRCLQGVWGVWKWMLSEPPLVRYNSWQTVVRYRNLYLIISNKMFPLQVNRGASKAPH